MTTITLRIDDNLKNDLQNIAKNLGLSLNQLINLKMREFRKHRSINIDFYDMEFISAEAIEGSDEFIGSELHNKGLNLLSNI